MKKKWFVLAMACMALTLGGCKEKGPSQLETARSAGIASMENGDYEQAIASFEQAYSLCDEKMPETKTDLALFKATCQYEQKDFAGVKDTCTDILTLGENADAYYLRGVSFLQLGEMDMAKADFDCAAAISPADYSLYLNIYKQYEQINQSAVGDTYLQLALSIQGEDLEDSYQKGCIYFYLKDYASAKECLATPVEAKHKDATALMGEVYLKLGDTASARSVYQQYLTNFGDTPEAYNGLVLCDIADGAYDSALTNAQQGLALEGEENKRDLRYNVIVAYEKKLDFAAAKEKAAEFVELYPEDEAGQREYAFLSTR